MIIGISGYKQSGKDSIAKIWRLLDSLPDTSIKRLGIIYDEYETWQLKSNWKIVRWADKLKQIVSILTGIPVEDMEKEEVKSAYLPSEWNRFVYLHGGRVLKVGSYGELLNWIDQHNEFASARGLVLFDRQNVQYQAITLRQALQWIGTDLFRDMFHPDTWVSATLQEYSEDQNWILPDTRFPNEAEKCDKIIRVNRSICEIEEGEFHHKWWDGIVINGKEEGNLMCFDDDDVCKTFEQYKKSRDSSSYKNLLHKSETSLDDWLFDHVIENNGDILNLIKQVKHVQESCL